MKGKMMIKETTYSRHSKGTALWLAMATSEYLLTTYPAEFEEVTEWLVTGLAPVGTLSDKALADLRDIEEYPFNVNFIEQRYSELEHEALMLVLVAEFGAGAASALEYIIMSGINYSDYDGSIWLSDETVIEIFNAIQ